MVKLFIENSIEQLEEKLNRDELDFQVIKDECIRLSLQNEKYKMWECFSCEKMEEFYECIKKDEKKKLNGIPIGVKDIMNTVDYPTQMGSVIWKGFEAGNDARIVHNIKYNGGVIAGKTVTAEFAVHTLNGTLNPYDVTKTPGTSSSGSAVAVAVGAVPVALASQTAGSIMRPASFCGVYGYKPSFGLIPRTGILKTTDSLDTIGFLTGNLKNLRTMFEVLRVKGPDYPFSHKALSDIKRQKCQNRKWKVAFIKTYTWDGAEKYVKNAIKSFVAKLQNDNDICVEEVEIESIIENAHNVHSLIYNKSLAYYFANEHNDKNNISDMMNQMIEEGENISVKDFLEALDVQEKKCAEMDSFMTEYDAIISMSTASVAPNRGIVEKDDPSLIWNLLHLSSVNVPQFYDAESGLPFGIQISARRYNDYLLLDFLDVLCNKGYIPLYCKNID